MGLIGLLAVALIICVLAFTSFKTYFTAPAPEVKKQVQEVTKEHPIDTTTYQSTVDSMKSQLKAASQAEIDHAQEMEGMK